MKTLKQWREYKKISVTKLAKASGVSKQAIYQYQNGATPGNVIKGNLARALNVMVSDIDWGVKTQIKFVEPIEVRERLSKEQRASKEEALRKLPVLINKVAQLDKERTSYSEILNMMESVPIKPEQGYLDSIKSKITDIEECLLKIFRLV